MISNSQDMERYVDKKGNVMVGSPGTNNTGSQSENDYRQNKLKNFRRQSAEIPKNAAQYDDNDSYNELNSSDQNQKSQNEKSQSSSQEQELRKSVNDEQSEDQNSSSNQDDDNDDDGSKSNHSFGDGRFGQPEQSFPSFHQLMNQSPPIVGSNLRLSNNSPSEEYEAIEGVDAQMQIESLRAENKRLTSLVKKYEQQLEGMSDVVMQLSCIKYKYDELLKKQGFSPQIDPPNNLQSDQNNQIKNKNQSEDDNDLIYQSAQKRQRIGSEASEAYLDKECISCMEEFTVNRPRFQMPQCVSNHNQIHETCFAIWNAQNQEEGCLLCKR